MEIKRKRIEAEIQAAEMEKELQKEREILELKRQREMEWVCKYFQYIEKLNFKTIYVIKYIYSSFSINIHMFKELLN